jgi:hypothetical protein
MAHCSPRRHVQRVRGKAIRPFERMVMSFSTSHPASIFVAMGSMSGDDFTVLTPGNNLAEVVTQRTR